MILASASFDTTPQRAKSETKGKEEITNSATMHEDRPKLGYPHGEEEGQQYDDGSLSSSVKMDWMPPKCYDLLVKVMTFGHEASLRREYLNIAKIGSNEKVLDVGCGTGECAILLAKEYVSNGGEVVGIDPTPSFVESAQKKADKQL